MVDDSHNNFTMALVETFEYRTAGIRPEDIQIAVTENYYEDWYAGRLHDA